MTIQSRKTFFVLLCFLLFFNGIGFLWKRRIAEKNNSKNFEFGISNTDQNAENFSWKRTVLETKIMVFNGNTSFIKYSKNSGIDHENHECDDVHNKPNKCEFVRKYCQDNYSGLIDYLQLYFCNSKKWRILILTLLFLWLLFLFGFIGIAASDFFCPNLSTIASKLKLSESMAGVTFLAFGNGSPDLFSTFSAITHGSGSLAIGELIGAASFIASVVAGSVAVVSPFRVAKAPFLRDVIFFSSAIFIVLTIIWDGNIHLWESIVLVLFYIIYVIAIFIGTWWTKDQKKRRWQEQKARDEYTPLLVDNGTENVCQHNEEEFENQDAYGYEPYGEIDFLLSENDRTDNTNRDVPPISLTPLAENELHHSHNHTWSGRPIHLRMRPSLFGAIEFRDVVNSLRLDSSARALGVFGRSYTTDFHNTRPNRPRSKTMPLNRPFSSLRRRSWASDDGAVMSTPILNVGNESSVDTTIGRESLSNNLSLPNYSTQSSSSLKKPDVSDTFIPPDQDGISSSSLSTSHLGDSNLSFNDIAHLSPNNSPSHSPDLAPTELSNLSFWDKVYTLFFPSLEGFSQKSFIAKLIGLMAIPANLVLTLTLPVIESEELNSNNIEKKSIENQLQTPTIVVDDDPDLVIVETPDIESKETRWNRWLIAVQFVFAPLFISSVLFYDSSNKIILFSFLGGIIVSILWISFTHDDKPPRFYSSLCFIGFGVAIIWIFLVANEVVGLLQALGLIMGLSDAIVGLTIFAMGNSLGDFVANVTIARMGFPTMAMSACFGGPMLNILIGIGVAGTYETINGSVIHVNIEPSLFISSIGLLIVLFSFLIYLPQNDYRMGRGWGYYSIFIYFTCMIISVVLEFTRMNNDNIF